MLFLSTTTPRLFWPQGFQARPSQVWPDLFIGCTVPSLGFCLLWQAETHLETPSVRVEWGQGTLWPWFMGISMRNPTSTSVGREGRGGGLLSRSTMESGSGKPSRASFPGLCRLPRESVLGEGGLGPLGQEPVGFQEGKHKIPLPACPFPVLPTGDKGGDLRACSSCACSSARHFWGLALGASIYWPKPGPVGEVRRGSQVTGRQTAPSVSLPSCSPHSSVSCFHAGSGTGPSLVCPEPGCPCLGLKLGRQG